MGNILKDSTFLSNGMPFPLSKQWMNVHYYHKKTCESITLAQYKNVYFWYNIWQPNLHVSNNND